MVFPTFFNLSLHFAVKAHDLSHSHLQVLFLLTVYLVSVLTIRSYPYVESSLWLLEKGVYYNQCVLLTKTASLHPASFCTPRPNLPVTPDISQLPTFAFWSPMMKRTSFFFFFFS